MPHEQLPRSQDMSASSTSEFETSGMASLQPPAMQLMASSDAPAQFKAQRVADLAQHQGALDESALESTAEFSVLMSASGAIQAALQLSAAEARLACLLMLEAVQSGKVVDVEQEGMSYAEQARTRLTPQAGQGPVRRLGTEIGEVSEERAAEIFAELAQLTFFNEHGQEMPVPYHYPPDGCYARAHLMAERLTAMGYASQKQFVVSRDQDNRGNLTVDSKYSSDSPKVSEPQVKWWYHVAPKITVIGASGEKKEMVIDPSMTSAPVDISSWISLMNVKNVQYMDISEVKSLRDADRKNYVKGKTITYGGRRQHYQPRDLTDQTTWESTHDRFTRDLPRISKYAELESIHEIAGAFRTAIELDSSDQSEVQGILENLSDAQVVEFAREFPNLLVEIKRYLPIGDLRRINNILSP